MSSRSSSWSVWALLSLAAGRCPSPQGLTALRTPPPHCRRETTLPAVPAAPLEQTVPYRPKRRDPARAVVARFDLHVDLEVPVPGRSGRFEYESADTIANRLYISRVNEVVVFDLQAEQMTGVFADLPGVTGVLVVPELGRVYASTTGRHTVTVIDAATGNVIATSGRIAAPAGLAYAPEQHKVYVSDESGGGELVIDAQSQRALGVIPIGGATSNTIYDPGSRCIIVVDEANDRLVAIDPAMDRVIGRYRPSGTARPHGAAIDPVHRLLFVANRRASTLQTVDLRTMRTMSIQPIGSEPDGLAFDPTWLRLYAGSESGVVSIFAVGEGGPALEAAITMPHAHTVTVDPRTHLMYFPLQDISGRSILRIMSGTPPLPSGGLRQPDDPPLTFLVLERWLQSSEKIE